MAGNGDATYRRNSGLIKAVGSGLSTWNNYESTKIELDNEAAMSALSLTQTKKHAVRAKENLVEKTRENAQTLNFKSRDLKYGLKTLEYQGLESERNSEVAQINNKSSYYQNRLKISSELNDARSKMTNNLLTNNGDYRASQARTSIGAEARMSKSAALSNNISKMNMLTNKANIEYKRIDSMEKIQLAKDQTEIAQAELDITKADNGLSILKQYNDINEQVQSAIELDQQRRDQIHDQNKQNKKASVEQMIIAGLSGAASFF